MGVGVPKVGYPQQGYLLARSDGTIWGGVPPSRVPPWPGLMGGTPPQVPEARSDRGYLRWGTLPAGVPPEGVTPLAGPGWGTLPSWTWPGYPPPEVWTDRRLWKQYLTFVLRTRSVNIELKKMNELSRVGGITLLAWCSFGVVVIVKGVSSSINAFWPILHRKHWNTHRNKLFKNCLQPSFLELRVHQHTKAQANYSSPISFDYSCQYRALSLKELSACSYVRV